MFILVQPMYSKQALNGDSNYIVYTQWIEAMHRARPDWHFVVIFPDAHSGFKYQDDGFFRQSFVTRVPQRINPRKRGNAITFDSVWYDALFDRMAFDVVWCNLVEIAAHFQPSESTTQGKPCVIAAHNYVIHPSLQYGDTGQTNLMLSQLMSSICADVNVFNSDHCRWMLFDNARRWLSPMATKAIEKTAVKINYGCLDGSLSYRPTGNTIPIVAYNHRLQAYKKFRETFALFDRLYGEGTPFRVWYMSNTSKDAAAIRNRPYVEIHLSKTHAEYLDRLRQCDLNVTNSIHETFCISAIESMALGQPLVAPDGITFPEITGRAENAYPYLFKTEDQQYDMVRRLLKDQGERERWGRVLSEHVRENYNQDLWASRYAELIESQPRSAGVIQDPKALDGVRRIAIENPELTVSEIRRKVNSMRVNGRIALGNQAMPPVRLLWLLREMGGRIIMRNGKQLVEFD